ncbi:MAG: CaiB/BaiF CoA transferase family protein, partial [Dehalococcoidia bacterium]
MAKEAFTGIKVADFSWNAVGPIMGSYLAKHGATVVKVESIHRLDSMRTSPPFLGGKVDPDLSACFPYLNHGKYGVTLDLRHPRAREVARRLAAWADIMLDAFTPGTMKKWGLSYEEVREINPGIIYLSTCNQGQTGPHARQPGFGTQLTALSGITHITGWPDRWPAFPFAAHTDFVSLRFGFAALIAALEYRERTGKGQYLDLSQHEASLHLMAPAILDYEVNGRVASRMGNRSPSATPHGVFPCRGDDRWCALTVGSDEEWQAFCRALGEPEWSQDP